MQEQGCGREPFALRVVGSSMSPEFNDGCIIIIDPEGVMNDGSYVLARDGEEFIFRQLIIDGERYLLKALEDGHAIITLPDLSSIEGVVIQQAGRRRADRKHYA